MIVNFSLSLSNRFHPSVSSIEKKGKGKKEVLTVGDLPKRYRKQFRRRDISLYSLVPVKEYRCIFRSKCKNWIVAWPSLFALFGTFLEIIHFEREKKGDVI